MKDAYEVLGIPRNASEQDIKTAYRTLAKKYHPDNFATSPDLAAVAEEKMREVNEAYDTVMRDLKSGGASSAGQQSAGYSASYSNTSSASSGQGYSQKQEYSYASNDQYSTTTQFPNVRKLIYENRFEDANAVLDTVPVERRNAEWNFLKGAVYYRRGWLEQAFKHFETAVSMDPNNSEFRGAYNQASNMRSGSSGGYREGRGGGCNPCGTCCSLLCADQCCECMGGDLISCI